ncbi:hypothetical protein JRQ81_007691 [Phrynocephalus forsythii]|uniref:Ig-like domain-containing protein n=1 Tax=Phrynocephalus forsythii TaxID=171643 RepID=A0A9Q1ATI8_9SAUR|nr:hypothetical protein JRQ81_007691 [Phrynocephalus forsythii]
MAKGLVVTAGCVFSLFALYAAAAGTEEWVVGQVGGDVTLTCRNASQRAVSVEWFHGEPGAIPILFSSDGKLPSDARFSLVGNSSLRISGLRLQDEGNYTCKEVLNETDHTHRIQLLMASGPERVNISISPATALPNGTLYAQRHDVLNFTCTSDSLPVPTTKWSFSQSSSNQELFTEVNSSLGYFVLYNMSPRYQGNYSCSATNPLSGHQATSTYELLIYDPPPLSPRCWAQISTEDFGLVQMFCTWSGGYPHPTLWWTNRENMTLAVDATNRTDTIVATLNSSHLDYGKEFVCHGHHITHQEESQACSIQLEGPLVMSDPIRTCFAGRAAIMTCQVTAGNPPAKITWLRNITQPGAEIQSGGRFLISQKGSISTLVIQNCSRGTDEGYYLCIAENPLGLKEVYVHLRVTEPVNIGGIVGATVVLLLLGVLILFGVLLYIGSRIWPKGNILRNRDESSILVLMDSEEEGQLTEMAEELPSPQAVANGSFTGPAEREPLLVAELKPRRPQQYDWKSSCETWSVAFSPDGDWFAWSQGHCVVTLLPWPLEATDRQYLKTKVKGRGAGAKEKTLECGQIVWGLAFSSWLPCPPKKHTLRAPSTSCLILATGLNDGQIKVWEVQTGCLLFNMVGHQDVVRDLSFAPGESSSILVSASRDKTVRVWDLSQNGKQLQVLSGHVQWVYCCSVSPDGQMLCSAAGEKSPHPVAIFCGPKQRLPRQFTAIGVFLT